MTPATGSPVNPHKKISWFPIGRMLRDEIQDYTKQKLTKDKNYNEEILNFENSLKMVEKHVKGLKEMIKDD